MTTRIIRVTECSQCPYRESYMVQRCELEDLHCPPTGTPDWCPLEMLEDQSCAK